MSRMKDILERLGTIKEIMVIVVAIGGMIWAGAEHIIKTINLHTDGVTTEMWQEHLQKDSIRVDVGVQLAANMMVKLDSTTFAIADLHQTIASLNTRLVRIEQKLAPDTATAVQRELQALKKMIAEAEEQRIKSAEAQRRQIASLQKAQEQLQPIQKGDRKP